MNKLKKREDTLQMSVFFMFHVKPIANDAPVSMVLLLPLRGTKYYRHHVN